MRLEPNQCRVLSCRLGALEWTRVSDVAEKLGMSVKTVSRAVCAGRRSGIVVRARDADRAPLAAVGARGYRLAGPSWREHGLTGKQALIAAYMWVNDHALSRQEIIHATGVGTGGISHILRALERKGVIERLGHGLWVIADL